MSTRRVVRLVSSLRIEGISPLPGLGDGQGAGELVGAFRSRPLDTGPHLDVRIDAPTQRCWEEAGG